MNGPLLTDEQVTERLGEPMVSAAQVARLLAVSERYIWRIARQGELPSYRIGKYVRFRVGDVEAFLERRRSGPRASRAHVESPRERPGKPGKGKRSTAPRRRF